MNRMVTQQMTQTQHHKVSSLVEDLLTHVWEEYHGIVFKLEATVLHEKQVSEEDATLLRTAVEFLLQVLPKVNSWLVDMIENMPHLEQGAGPR